MSWSSHAIVGVYASATLRPQRGCDDLAEERRLWEVHGGRSGGAGHRRVGIGREAALLLADAGARVMITARGEPELAAVGLDHVAADLGAAGECERLVAETERRLGRSTCWS
jgi:hypothetical protein